MNKDLNESSKKISTFLVVAFVILVLILINSFSTEEISKTTDKYLKKSDKVFKLISSTENKDLESAILEFAKKEDIDLEIEYAGTIDIMQKLNSGEKYDAVWASNSIWLYMLDSSKVSTINSKSISTNPVVFGITESKAKELGFIGKEIYTKDIVDAIKAGKLKFSMPNPTRTNTGATAYLGLLSTLAGNPEVLRSEHLQEETLKEDLVSLFSGMERSSGSEDFLEELFLNGKYEALITYEFSIINMNKKLVAQGKEPLYMLYPIDGVSISDSPLALIKNGNDTKKEQFKKLQDFMLSDEGQKILAEKGRRTWYGGVKTNVDQTIFNKEWGIDTTKYIVPVKYPNTDIIKKALAMYQTEFRKPVHTAFCLDFSGSMSGDGYEQLKAAMDYILNEESASRDLLQFSEKDKITVIPFSSNVIDVWNTENGIQTQTLLKNINSLKPFGGTNIYDSAIEALEKLDSDNLEEYNLSVILMTDGQANTGTFRDLRNYYNTQNKNIPIYSIMFGDAYEKELLDIAKLTNAKVFNGKVDLLQAFKEVRGYN